MLRIIFDRSGLAAFVSFGALCVSTSACTAPPRELPPPVVPPSLVAEPEATPRGEMSGPAADEDAHAPQEQAIVR